MEATDKKLHQTSFIMKGLRSESLNGATGIGSPWDAKSGRWSVQLAGPSTDSSSGATVTGRCVSVKPENLEAMG